VRFLRVWRLRNDAVPSLEFSDYVAGKVWERCWLEPHDLPFRLIEPALQIRWQLGEGKSDCEGQETSETANGFILRLLVHFTGQLIA